jgi:hypothetical protein
MKLRSFVALSVCLTLPGLARATEVGPPAPPPARAAAAPSGYPPPYAPPQGYAPPYPPPQGYAPAPGYPSPQGPGYYPPPNPYSGYPPTQGYPPPAYYNAQRLALLDAQIEELRDQRERYTLGGPIGLMIGGAIVAGVGALVLTASTCDSTYDDTYGSSNTGCDPNGAVAGAFIFVGGAAIATVGTVMLIVRASKRHRVDRQIAARQLESNVLRGLGLPRVDFVPTRTGGGVMTLAVDF